MARLPKAPMMAVASVGPATQANEMIARVFTTSEGPAPECLRWANKREVPTPAGPPRTHRPTRAIGSVVVTARRAARARVSSPQASMTRR